MIYDGLYLFLPNWCVALKFSVFSRFQQDLAIKIRLKCFFPSPFFCIFSGISVESMFEISRPIYIIHYLIEMCFSSFLFSWKQLFFCFFKMTRTFSGRRQRKTVLRSLRTNECRLMEHKCDYFCGRNCRNKDTFNISDVSGAWVKMGLNMFESGLNEFSNNKGNNNALWNFILELTKHFDPKYKWMFKFYPFNLL